jgi:hypothetical protein
VLHLLRIRLCYIREIEDEQSAIPDPGGALREHRVADPGKLGSLQVP